MGILDQFFGGAVRAAGGTAARGAIKKATGSGAKAGAKVVEGAAKAEAQIPAMTAAIRKQMYTAGRGNLARQQGKVLEAYGDVPVDLSTALSGVPLDGPGAKMLEELVLKSGVKPTLKQLDSIARRMHNTDRVTQKVLIDAIRANPNVAKYANAHDDFVSMATNIENLWSASNGVPTMSDQAVDVGTSLSPHLQALGEAVGGEVNKWIKRAVVATGGAAVATAAAIKGLNMAYPGDKPAMPESSTTATPLMDSDKVNTQFEQWKAAQEAMKAQAAQQQQQAPRQ